MPSLGMLHGCLYQDHFTRWCCPAPRPPNVKGYPGGPDRYARSLEGTSTLKSGEDTGGARLHTAASRPVSLALRFLFERALCEKLGNPMWEFPRITGLMKTPHTRAPTKEDRQSMETAISEPLGAPSKTAGRDKKEGSSALSGLERQLDLPYGRVVP